MISISRKPLALQKGTGKKTELERRPGSSSWDLLRTLAYPRIRPCVQSLSGNVKGLIFQGVHRNIPYPGDEDHTISEIFTKLFLEWTGQTLDTFSELSGGCYRRLQGPGYRGSAEATTRYSKMSSGTHQCPCERARHDLCPTKGISTDEVPENCRHQMELRLLPPGLVGGHSHPGRSLLPREDSRRKLAGDPCWTA